MLSHLFEEKIYVGGRMNLLDFEPSQDVRQFKSMYSFMKNAEELTNYWHRETPRFRSALVRN